MPKYSVLIARFPYGGIEPSKGVDWLLKILPAIKSDKRISEVSTITLDDTPITMTRNKACRIALEHNVDFLLMIDNDVVPDWHASRPFWDSSFQFLVDFKQPAIVAAPYCGPPPLENIYVFRWRTHESDKPDDEMDVSLQQYTREEAFDRVGIEEVAALPTGLLLMSVAVLKNPRLTKPWFCYEYTDDYCTEKATTEDVYFTRNASLAGIPVFCNWDSWAGHIKKKVVGKPNILTADLFRQRVQEIIRNQKDSSIKQIEMRR